MGAYRKTSRSNGQQSRVDFDLLPTPQAYLAKHLNVSIDTGKEWQKLSTCPFCGNHYTLSVHTTKGFFKCRSADCNATGGGILKFHMLLKHIDFKEACKQLGIWQGKGYVRGVPIYDK